MATGAPSCCYGPAWVWVCWHLTRDHAPARVMHRMHSASPADTMSHLLTLCDSSIACRCVLKMHWYVLWGHTYLPSEILLPEDTFPDLLSLCALSCNHPLHAQPIGFCILCQLVPCTFCQITCLVQTSCCLFRAPPGKRSVKICGVQRIAVVAVLWTISLLLLYYRVAYLTFLIAIIVGRLMP